MIIRRLTTIIFLALLSFTACTPGHQQPSADLILTGGQILTTNPATAIAIKGTRILAVGDDQAMAAYIGPHTQVIPLAGAVVAPGFNDSHAHLYGLGKALAEVDLMDTPSPAAVTAKIAQAAAALPPNAWLAGRGWDQNDWPVQEYPTADQLDLVTGSHPAVLRRVDGHAVWANHAALRAAGITVATPDPSGGEILRDKQGQPTGILIDNAVGLMATAIPTPSAAEVERRVKLAIEKCWSEGVTGVHEAGVSWDRAQLYQRLAAAGELGLRLYGMYDDEPATLEAGFTAGPFFSADSLLTIRAVKLYADGALGSRGALLLQDYSDRPGHHGLPVTSADHLREVVRRAADAGFQVGTHAIGDAANRLVLDIYEQVLNDLPAGDRRWRIEHAQILDPQDIPRFAKLGVIAAMQPTHCTSDMDWAGTRLGQQRLRGAYAWRWLLDSGAHVCFGTDFPVERVNPFAGLYSARTRTHQDGTPPGGWQPQERLTAAEAFALYTEGSAYAAFQENELGRIEVGWLADLTVLDGNPITAPDQDLLTMQVLHTIVNGELVYSR